MSDLLKLFDKYDTDKGTRKHLYNIVYEPHFEKVRYEPINILEVGIFKGESLGALREYFSNATIHGIDIFVRQQPEEISILKKDRIKWLKADSMKPKVKDLIKKEWGDDIQFDIIIDDGAHYPEANRLTFKYMNEFLKIDGKYFIEDVWPINLMDFKEMQHPWILKDPNRYNRASYTLFMDEVRRFDYFLYDVRQKPTEYIPDSTIMLIEHNEQTV